MIRSRILREAVSHWNSHFTGIRGVDLSERTGIPHRRVLSILRNLESRGLGRCRCIGPAQSMVVEVAADRSTRVRMEPCPASVIFFPAKEVLQQELKRAGMDRGRYMNLLHVGESQFALRYFRLDVLRRYSEQQERYHFEDSVIDGWIGTRDQYYFKLEKEGREQEAVGQVRYGKRRLANQEIAVAAFLRDLAPLPLKEQKYWESFELDSAGFAAEDPDFHKFVEQEYEGRYVDHDDPLSRLYDVVAEMNSLFPGEKLFKNDGQNPHLRYPTLNNHRAYSAAHKELWKLVGTDSLNRCLIEHLLAQRNLPVSISDNEGTLSKFRRLLASLDPGVADSLFSPLQKCRDARIEDAHKVDPLELPTGNYIEQFRQDCLALVNVFSRIRELLAGSALGREVANG